MSTDAETFDLEPCLERVRVGDQQAARDLVEHLYPQVIRIVRGRLPRRLDEEDLAQEVFLKMFSRLEQYRADMPFSHWVARIAVTTCIDQLRKQQRRPELRWADLSETEATLLDVATPDPKQPDIAEVTAARDLLEKLLGQLKPDDRLVLELLDVERHSIAEISEMTGWATALVKVRAFRARRKLHKLFIKLESEERT